MPIRVLDKSVAELIAAGEVIERPSSVVKELIENSVDANARNITVEIKNGGVSFMRVSDDGGGIPFDEAPIAFLRHATSKVATSDDLTAISTLGFRGEALASVAAVSRISLLTKIRDEQTGTSYKIEGGVETERSRAGCPDGTTIIIRDLFFNTPARLKFLKKDVSEGNMVQNAVEKAALINPQISFKFIRDNREVFVTPGDGRLYSSVYALFGKSFAASLIPADYSQNGINVKGYVSSPLFCRSNRVFQHFFVNSRYIRSAACTAALEAGYKNSVMTGKFPACALNILINPADVDANVHPAKTEVRFADDKAVFDALYFAVKNALLNHDREPEYAPAVQTVQPIQTAQPIQTVAFNSERTEYVTAPEPVIAQFKYISPETFVKKPVVNEKILIEYKSEPESVKILGEIFDTYIVCECAENMIIVDKHAADERIRFERLKKELKSHSQLLIENVAVELDAEGVDALIRASDELSEIGVVFTEDNMTVNITAMPALLNAGDAPVIISEIAETLKNGEGAQNKFGLFDEILHSVACRAAIKAGDKSPRYDMEQLARRIIGDPELSRCPHGRPTTVTLTKRDFEKMFKRIV